MSNVPKFDFSKSTFKTEEDLDAALQGDKKADSPYLRAGRHEVVISSAEYKGPASDARWQKLEIVYEAANKKTIKKTMLVPTTSFEYRGSSGKDTLFVFQKFNNWIVSLGIPKITVKSAPVTLTEYFGKPEKSLKGMSLAITVGYDGNYVDYAGKDEIGNKKYQIRMKDGSTLLDKATLKTITFPDFDAAKGHAEQHQIVLQNFPDVLETSPGAVPSKVANSSW